VYFTYFAVVVSTAAVEVTTAVQALTAQVSAQTALAVSATGVSVVGTAALSQEVKTKANNAITTKVKVDFFILQIYSNKNTKAKSKSWLFLIK
jgi:hypothetical protein